MRLLIIRMIGLVLALGIIPLPAHAAAACGGDFGAWLQGLKQDAAAGGVSQRTIASALANVTYDPSIIARDHAQGVFKQSFEQFSGRMVPPRLSRGKLMLQQYGSVFVRIEQQFGVPGPVIVAIWGLETDYGVNTGKFPTVRSLVSWPTIADGLTNSAAKRSRRCRSSTAATWRHPTCAAPGPARSARPSSCRRPI